MNYKQLKELFWQHERDYPKTHLTGYITFASFGPGNKKEYPWSSRTYIVSSDNKAFQPNKGGYSIFGNSLDGTDPCVRLDGYMAEEYSGKDGWVVEDCCIAGYLLIECSECNITAPKLFYTHGEAEHDMLLQLAGKGEYDVEQLEKEYSATGKLFEEGKYGIERDDAWLASPCEDWHWKIQPVCIYSPLKMVFPETGEKMMFTMEGQANIIRFEQNGVKYAMTEQEIEAAYRYQDHQYRLKDAKRQVNIFIFGVDDGSDFDDPEGEQAKNYFGEVYGISYDLAISQDMLEEYLRRFVDRFDCSLDENSQWEAAIRATLEDLKEGSGIAHG